MRQPQPVGRTIPLSLPRRFICDLLHFAMQVPTVPVERRMNLSAVVAARKAAVPRPSWCAIFTKAFGLVSATYPELRRVYLSYPRPHLYEHPTSTVSVAIERHLGDENAVLPSQIRRVEERSIRYLDARIRALKDEPVERDSAFRLAFRVSALPWPLRRLLWWLALNLSGRRRVQFMGTFGVSVYGSLGAASLHPLSPLTSTLTTGVIGEDGMVDVRLVYDHRTLDGATVARALGDLEQKLNGEIVNELRYHQTLDAA